jgi:hypothetical protein
VKLVEKPYHKSANALLIHRSAVPLPRWGRLFAKSKFEDYCNKVKTKKRRAISLFVFLIQAFQLE